MMPHYKKHTAVIVVLFSIQVIPSLALAYEPKLIPINPSGPSTDTQSTAPDNQTTTETPLTEAEVPPQQPLPVHTSSSYEYGFFKHFEMGYNFGQIKQANGGCDWINMAEFGGSIFDNERQYIGLLFEYGDRGWDPSEVTKSSRLSMQYTGLYATWTPYDKNTGMALQFRVGTIRTNYTTFAGGTNQDNGWSYGVSILGGGERTKVHFLSYNVINVNGTNYYSFTMSWVLLFYMAAESNL